VLDPARWIAGHTSVEHLYAYIEREFPSSQLGELEAEWAMEKLAAYDTSTINTGNACEGINDLYRRVLARFNSTSLNLIEERQWKRYVRLLFDEDYHLEPYSVVGDNGDSKFCVAIRAERRTSRVGR
jgi:hypothetical protein